MKKILICAVSLGLALLSFAQEQPTRLSLEGCLKYAEEHNYTLQNAKLDQSVSEINYKQAKLQMSPTVSASASQGFSNSHSIWDCVFFQFFFNVRQKFFRIC